jgi:hypothetical protein
LAYLCGIIQNLSLKITHVKPIAIDQDQGSDPGCGEVKSSRRPQSTQAHHGDRCPTQAALPLKTYFRQAYLPGKALLEIIGHRSTSRRQCHQFNPVIRGQVDGSPMIGRDHLPVV